MSSSSPIDNSVRIHDYSNDQTAESIKHVAKDIRESSSSIRELILTFIRSGAIEEMMRTIIETSTAIRDTANEINDAIKEVREREIKDTDRAIEETTKQVADTAPTTAKILRGKREG